MYLLKKFRGEISLTLRKSPEYSGQFLKSSVNPLLSFLIPLMALFKNALYNLDGKKIRDHS
jgi:hypothetical protein